MTFCSGTPFFLGNASRRIFALLFNANPDVSFKGVVLHLPAFAEEMNKSRAMVISQARAMASDGYTVLVPDYYGTGDSYGDFSEATWNGWLEDLHYCLCWLQEKAQGPVIFWGLRLGALLALELASVSECKPSRLVLWNPVLQGEQYMLQFLRLRLVNSMMYGDAKEKVVDLKLHLEEEGVLEVAGYELSASMFREVTTRKAVAFQAPPALKVFWADVTSVVKSLPVPSQTLIDQWLAASVDVHVEQVAGPQFWATQEITRANDLIEKTTEWLRASCMPYAELENS